MWRTSSSAPLAPARRMASSNAHSDAVEKSVGMRIRRQGYMSVARLLSCWELFSSPATQQLRNLFCGDRLLSCSYRRDDVADHRLGLRFGLSHLQQHLLVGRFQCVAGDEGVLHCLVELHFECPPVLRRRKRRLTGIGAELREVRGVVVVDL